MRNRKKNTKNCGEKEFKMKKKIKQNENTMTEKLNRHEHFCFVCEG